MGRLTRITAAIATAALTIAIAGCTGGPLGGGNNPVGVVNEAMNAAESGGLGRLTEFACEAMQDDVTAAFGGADMSALTALGVDPNEIFDAVKVDFQDMAVTEASQSGGEATVHIKGTIATTVDETKIREIMRQVIEAQGIPATDEMIDQALALAGDQLSQSQPIDTDVKLVQENGKWLICS